MYTLYIMHVKFLTYSNFTLLVPTFCSIDEGGLPVFHVKDFIRIGVELMNQHNRVLNRLKVHNYKKIQKKSQISNKKSHICNIFKFDTFPPSFLEY